MPYLLAILACIISISCGGQPERAHVTPAHEARAETAGQCHVDLSVKDWTEGTGERRASLDFTLTLDGPNSIPVPYPVDAEGLPVLGLVSTYNAKDAGTKAGAFKLIAEDGWETLQPSKGNQVRLGSIITVSGPVGEPSSVSVAGHPCSVTINSVPHVVPPVAQTKAPPQDAPAPTFAASTPPPASAASSNPLFGTDAQRATVREYIRKLMDETRVVPDTAARKGGPRGSAGSYAKLSAAQVDEFISAIIYGSSLFMPKGLKDEERWALVAAEISIESAFTPATSGDNPGNQDGGPHYISVGPLQLTLNADPSGKGMWDDIFRQYANIPGLIYYDGSVWDTKATKNEEISTSIFTGIISSLWCITEQGRRGCPDWFGQNGDGPCPKTMHTAFLAWVIGGPALKSGGDLAGQRDMYIASIGTDLKLIGFSDDLINSAF